MTTVKSGVTTPLPAAANLEHLKKQAKQLLHAFRAGEAEAQRTIAGLHPRPEIFAGLRDAQLVVARRYGYQDWQQLTQAVELQRLRAATLQQQAEQFIYLACLRYNGDDRAWRYDHANALLAELPQLVEANLYSALVAGNLAAVQRHLDQQPDLATQNGGPLQWPPLMYLTYSRVHANKDEVLGILQLLLSRGADPDSHVMFDGLYRFSALTGAMGEGERGPVACPPHPHAAALVDALLDAGASPNEFQGLYNTMFTDSLDTWLPLLIAHGLAASHTTDPANSESETTFDFILSQAIPAGRSKRIWLLLMHGANANAINRYNHRSAHTNAVLAGHKDIAAALLQYGATVEKLNTADEFRVACWNNDLDRADVLLQQHPALKQDPQLFSDVARTHTLLAPWLVQRGFDINSQTRDGRTVLHRIAASNELNEVKALLALGANAELTDYHYHATPLGFALHNRAWDVAHHLKEFSSDIFDVCRVAYVSRVAALLQKNPALATRRTPLGNTPLHVVGQAFDDNVDVVAAQQVIELLLQHGADPIARNNEGMTPRQWLRKMGNEEVAELLQPYDAD